MYRILLRMTSALACLATCLAASAADAAPPKGPTLAYRDTSCAPCRDFFKYANGAWFDTATIAASNTSTGASQELTDRNQETLHRMLDRAVADVSARPGTDPWRLHVFCAACMDSARAEREGATPVQPTLDDIAAIRTPEELAACLGRLHARGTRTLFSFGSQQDRKNSEDVIASTGQGGLGLPEREYYFRADSSSMRLREEYKTHVTRLLQLAGEPEAVAMGHAARVLEIETALARASMTRVERRDPQATYHRMPLKDMEALAPAFRWDAYLAAAGAPKIVDINVQHPPFLRAVDSLLRAVPVEDWKVYFRAHALNGAASALSPAFESEDFRFGRLLTGARALPPRWKRCLRAADVSLGEILGQEYVKESFSPGAKARVLEMVRNIQAALRDRIRELDWMNDSTKAQAIAKLDAMDVKMGYPDKWRDYSSLQLEDGPFLANLSHAREFGWRREMARIGAPVDRTEWFMTPPTVNAYYNSGRNEIVFPAGILQPPYFDPAADDAVNYGETGAVIGHEMTHGFDDSGRQFDGKGNMRDWWTAADAEHYKTRAKLVEEQFNGFVGVDTLHVNGKLTLGENIADLGGLVIAFNAYEKSLAGKPRTAIDGLTPEQRFFLAYAESWRDKRRPERMRTLIQTDPHSPDGLRVLGPLQNFVEFARAFGCRPGDAMVRPDSLRARIW